MLVNSANYCERQSGICKCSSTGDACTPPEYCMADTCEGDCWYPIAYDYKILKFHNVDMINA